MKLPRFRLVLLGSLAIAALAPTACSSRPSRDAGLKKDIAFLEDATKELLDGSIIKASDGTPLYTPDGKAQYAALWTRDFASMVENAGDLMSQENIEKCIDYLIKGIREDGAVPDRVQVDGCPVYAAGAPETPLGEPNIDSGRGPGLARGSTSAVLARGYKPRASGEPKARPLATPSSLSLRSRATSIWYPRIARSFSTENGRPSSRGA